MGWLELITLLKRVLPLLSRLAPMLEGYVGARGATRGDAEALERLSGDLKANFAAAGQNQTELKDVLTAQNGRLLRLVDELQHLRAAGAETNARMERIEQQTASNTRLLRIASLLSIVLLLACAGLLIELLRRH